MATFDWSAFLRQFNTELLASAELAEAVQVFNGDLAAAARTGWLGFPGASEEWLARCEAWMYAHWLPGASRYRSFKDLMEGERRSFLQIEAHEMGRPQPGEPPSQLQAKLPNLIEAISSRSRVSRESERKRPGVESFIEAATAQGLEEVAEQVRRLQAQHLDSEALLASLRALEQSASQEHMATQDRWVRKRKPCDLLRIFSGAKALARGEGLGQAAGEIRWFLEKVGG